MTNAHTTGTHLPSTPGVFTVSLDFELYWGVRDKIDLATYGPNLLGARNIIPDLLDLFAEYGVHATWATVGFLFFDDKDELLAHLPAIRPGYADPNLSPYPHVHRIGRNEREDPYHYARSLVRRIAQYPGQEIGTHTFSHYYCLEPGQTVAEFRADLQAAHAAAKQLGIELKSLVFPRNQWRPDYLEVCAETGIRAVRGQKRAWMYRPASGRHGPMKRALRLVDSYASLSGPDSQSPLLCLPGLVDVPSSRLLRAYSPRLARLRPLQLRRIRAGMRHAAEHGRIYHLWWHPHNFGANQRENLTMLRGILEHFRSLAGRYGMISRSMGEIAAQAETALGPDPVPHGAPRPSMAS